VKVFIRFFFLLLLSGLVNAEIIKNISIKGLDNISRGTVLEYLPVEVGDELISDQVMSLKEAILKTDFFNDVEIEFYEGALTIKVVENPIIKFFEVLGFKEDLILSEEIIGNIKKNYGLENGKIFINKNFDSLVKDLTNLYQSNAFFGAKISIKKSVDTNNRIGVEINIDEGEQALIKKMSISGNTFFSDEELLDLFNIGEPDFFVINFFTEKDRFSKIELQSGIDLATSKYLNAGFLDIQIDSKNISFAKESNSINININISEGKQYLVDSISFTGELMGSDPGELRKIIDVDDNTPFGRKSIINGIDKITQLFENKGFAFTNISPIINVIPDSNKLKIDIEISPDSEIYIGRIVISGNNTTQDDVIRREMSIYEGQIYSREQILESIKNIKRLGFFSKVDYEIKKYQNESKVDILIDVIETKTGEVSIGLSHSNATGASLSAGISQKNILGTGNTLNASISNSSAVKNASFYFLDPYFNNFGHAVSYGFFDRTTDAAELDASSYILDETGLKFGYGIPTSTYGKIFSELKVSSVDLSCGESLKNIYEVSQCNNNDSLESSLSLSYEENSLNDFFFPSSGSKNIFKTTAGLPGSDFKFLQSEISHKSYYPFLKDKTFKFSSRGKVITPYGGDEVPFFKRFLEGGNSSVRGFDFNSLGAKYSGTDKPKGGEFSLFSSVAVASSLKFVGIDNPNMKISGFIDTGGISEKTNDFSFSDIRSSTGVQFSWLTPIGPIGLHFATPIIKKSGDSITKFSFDLGTTF